MMNIVVVDVSAESRHRLVDRLTSHLRSQQENIPLLPRASVKPLSPQELNFHAAPDLCILGPELVTQDLVEIARIRKILPSSPLIVFAPRDLSSLSIVEQMARLGADDVFLEDIAAEEFVRKLILLARKSHKPSSGKLVLVEGGKGGVGATSVTAGLAEVLFDHGQRVAVVDGDFESQDLSRFMQARPFINEPLRLLLDQQRPVTDEFVAQCLVPIWQDAETLRCLPPPPETDDLYSATAAQARIFASIFEALDAQFDCVLVDVAALRGMLRSVLYRIADTVLLIVSNDPSSLFASLDRVEKIEASMTAGAHLFLAENCCFPGGISNGLLREEFQRSARIQPEQWIPDSIPFCRQAARWPASGRTMRSEGSAKVGESLTQLASRMQLIPEQAVQRHSWLNWVSWGAGRAVSTQKSTVQQLSAIASAPAALPAPKAPHAPKLLVEAPQITQAASLERAEAPGYSAQDFVTRAKVA